MTLDASLLQPSLTLVSEREERVTERFYEVVSDMMLAAYPDSSDPGHRPG